MELAVARLKARGTMRSFFVFAGVLHFGTSPPAAHTHTAPYLLHFVGEMLRSA